MKVFINGVLVASTNNAPSSMNNNSNSLYIGADQNALNNAAYDTTGSLDEVRIYNRALSPAEVRALYNYAPGPVAHWKLDDKTGTSATDTSGNGNTGTLTNSPAWTVGKYGSSVKFDGSDDYITAADSSSLDVTRSGSWAFWFNLASLPSGADGKFIDKWTGTGNQRSYQIYPTTTNKLSIDLSSDGTSGGATTLNSSDTLTANTWYHASVTYDSSTVRMYINGNLQSSTAAIAGIFNSTANLSLGGDNQGSTNFANGRMDDVRIYNYALSSKQIMNIMAGGDVNDPAVAAVAAGKGGPVLSMNFDEGYGTTARDASSAGNNGTLTNMASPATSTSGWSGSGKYGKALAFDGSNDYVDIANASSLQTENWSVSVWYKTSYNGATVKRITTKEPVAGTNYMALLIGSGRIFGSAWNGSTEIKVTDPNITSDNNWHNAIYVRDTATRKYFLYIDGVLKAQADDTLGTLSNSANLRIGAATTSLVHLWAGYLDEVKIYPYALTEDDIRLEYNRGSALVLGAKSTAADGITADNSSSREYCVPGDTATCNAPVAEWKLDEGTGTSAQDTTGGGNTGTLTGGPTWTKGKMGRAVKFDGSDDYIDAGNSASVNITGTTISYQAWVKVNQVLGSSSYQVIVVKANADASGWHGLWYVNGTGGISCDNKFLFGLNGGWLVCSTTSPIVGKWYHIEATANGTQAKIYVNGIEEGSVNYSTTLGTTNGNLEIGRRAADGRYFNGLIDNVRIYNYARTPAQIAWEYNKGAPVAHYRLDECQGTTAYNSAPSASGDAPGNNGTITIGASGTNTSAGACTGSAGEAWKDGASGKLGASLEFDGNDDYVDMGAISSYAFNNTFSWAYWVRFNYAGGTQTPLIWTNTGGYFSSLCNGCTSGSKLTFGRNGQAHDVISTNNITSGQWYHVVNTVDASGNVVMYLNGVVEKTGTTTLTTPSGSFRISDTTYPVNGQIDDVRIYNYALTPVQVRSLYNDGAVSFK